LKSAWTLNPMENIHKIALTLSLTIIGGFTRVAAQQDAWVNTAGPFRGDAQSIAAGPHGVWFALTLDGVYRSDDHFATWTLKNSDPLELNLDSTSFLLPLSRIITGSDGTVYITLPESTSYRSTNGGDSWDRLYVTASDPRIALLVPGISADLFALTDTNGVYHSRDHGSTWDRISLNIPASSVTGIGVTSQGTVLAYSAGIVYRTTDSGIHWTAGADSVVFGGSPRFAFGPGGTAFLGKGSELGTGDLLFRSTDGGNHWSTLIPAPGGRPPRPAGLNGIAVDSTGCVYVVDISGKLSSSTDNGDTWNTLTYEPYWGGELDVRLSAGSNGEVALSTQSNGLFLSTDKGGTWSKDAGFLSVSTNSLAASGSVHAAADSGVYRSLGPGSAWLRVIPGTYGQNPALLKFNSKGTLFAGMKGAGIFRSTNDGDFWTKLVPPLSGLFGIDFRDTLITSSQAILGPANLYSSGNDGNSWQCIDSNLTWPPNVFAFGPGRIVLAGTLAPGVAMRSTDNGRSWTGTAVLPRAMIYALAFTPDWTLFAGTDSGLFRSTNFGETWANISTGLPPTVAGISFFNGIPTLVYALPRIRSIVTRESTVYIGYDRGVYWSSDRGDSWTSLNAGLPFDPGFTALCIESDGVLYGGTRAGTVYWIRIPITGVTARRGGPPVRFALEQNYPNPFNPSTTIRYSVGRRSSVVVGVFNLVGQLIVKLVDRVQAAGTYEVRLDGSNLATGVYFYRLQADGYSQTRRLVIVR